MSATVIDVVLGLVLLSYAAAGYRRGLLGTLVQAIGLVVGGGLVLFYLPQRLDGLPVATGVGRAIVLLLAVLVGGGLGQLLAGLIAAKLVNSMRRSPMRGLDALAGAVVNVVVVSLALWFAGGLLREAAPAPVRGAIAGSKVIATIDRFVPTPSDRLLSRAMLALDGYGFPRVFESREAETIREVAGVDNSIENKAGVQAARHAVVRIDATAVACGGRSVEGSGWVAGRQLVVTNAHVVAGAEQVRVTFNEQRYAARVVAFDANRDLAVLVAPRLDAQPLSEGPDLARDGSAAVAGFPLGGPYQVDAARIRDVMTAEGEDIYGQDGVVREIYSLRAAIHPGNSGGPLLDAAGRVVGVVFARSRDDATTGYALTLDEVRPVLADVSASSPSVGTGDCPTS